MYGKSFDCRQRSTLCEELKTILTNESYKAYATDKPNRALSMLENDNIFIIIMGYQNEDQNHLKPLEHAKKKFKKIKVLLISDVLDENILTELKGYIDSALLKPLDMEKLLHTIKKLVAKRQKESSLNKMDRKIFQTG